MYVNNISERSSSRVLQRPGGNQSINIFGGSDEPVADAPQRRTGRRQQQDITPSIGSQAALVEQPKPSFTSHTSSISSVFNDAAPAPASAATPQQTVAQVNAPFAQDSQPAAGIQPAAGAAPRVNNIWGSDDDQPQRSSTRVLRGPGGGSSGVGGALGGGAEPEVEQRKASGYRANQTSANSPFSSEPEPQRSSTRIRQAPGGNAGNGNILSWGH